MACTGLTRTSFVGARLTGCSTWNRGRGTHLSTRSCKQRRLRIRSLQDDGKEDEEEPADGKAPNPFEGLKMDKNGDLIDTKTGKALNDFGAGRFDIAVRALRGEMGGAYSGEGSTENDSGQILDSLVRFPSPYTFTVVGKNSEGFVEDMVRCVKEQCGTNVLHEVKERKGGKFVSISITGVVESSERVQDVYEELGKDKRVMMKF